MLRITRVASSDSPTLKVEGKLVGPWVEELRQVCTELTEAAGPLSLDLSAVSFVDAAGVRLVRDLLREGMTLAACSGLVAELLNGEAR
jgi:anti-anti-sigma regulatory factor